MLQPQGMGRCMWAAIIMAMHICTASAQLSVTLSAKTSVSGLPRTATPVCVSTTVCKAWMGKDLITTATASGSNLKYRFTVKKQSGGTDLVTCMKGTSWEQNYLCPENVFTLNKAKLESLMSTEGSLVGSKKQLPLKIKVVVADGFDSTTNQPTGNYGQKTQSLTVYADASCCPTPSPPSASASTSASSAASGGWCTSSTAGIQASCASYTTKAACEAVPGQQDSCYWTTGSGSASASITGSTSSSSSSSSSVAGSGASGGGAGAKTGSSTASQSSSTATTPAGAQGGTDANKDELSSSGTIGVVIGVIIGCFLLIAGLAYYGHKTGKWTFGHRKHGFKASVKEPLLESDPDASMSMELRDLDDDDADRPPDFDRRTSEALLNEFLPSPAERTRRERRSTHTSLCCKPGDQRDIPVDVVMSYRTQSSNDRRGGEKLMVRVVEELEKAGYTTFNGKQVPGGGDWREWWGAKAKRCKVVVLILSQVFFESKACIEELNYARSSGRHIMPLMAEPYHDIPVGCEMILQGYNRIPSTGCFADDFEENVDIMLDALLRWTHAHAEDSCEGAGNLDRQLVTGHGAKPKMAPIDSDSVVRMTL